MPRMILQALDIHDKMSHRIAAGVEAGSLAYVVGANPLGIGMDFSMRCVVGGMAWIAYEHALDPSQSSSARRRL